MSVDLERLRASLLSEPADGDFVQEGWRGKVCR